MDRLLEEINDIRRRAGLCEERMVKVWHVTEKQNVVTILKHGLEPRIGKSSRSAGEKEPKIYVFPDELSMEDAISNWLGDETPYRQSVLELTVPQRWVEPDPSRWEAHIRNPVPPQMIRVAIPDIDEVDTMLGEGPPKEKILTLYHGSNVPIKKFNRDFSAQGVFWFSEDKDKILRDESGAASSKFVMTCKVKVSKTAGWEEYEKLALGQIEQMGFDSIKLDDDWVIFDARRIKVVGVEERA